MTKEKVTDHERKEYETAIQTMKNESENQYAKANADNTLKEIFDEYKPIAFTPSVKMPGEVMHELIAHHM